MTDLLPLLSNVWSFFLVVLFFGGSIFVHELGHFLAARRRGAVVERFSIGFGPAIWSHRGKDGVEYRLSWIPLGGYVLLPQLADLGAIEGESTTDVKKIPPIAYGSKMLILVAGATFNILFAILLACVVSIIGVPTTSLNNTTKIGAVSPTLRLGEGDQTVPNPAVEAGLRAGDVIRSIDGHAVSSFEEILTNVALGKDRTDDGRRRSTFEIDREGKPLKLVVYPRLYGTDKIRDAGIEPADDLTVEATMPGSPALAAGFLSGDVIVALEGKPIFSRTAVREHLAANPQVASEFLVLRNGAPMTIKAQPRMESDEVTGKPIARVGLRYREYIVILHPSPWANISKVVMGAWQNLSAVISPSSDVHTSMLSGPLGIARELHRQAQVDYRAAFNFTILLNVSLAIFNLLPIPVLDGGQMLFATIGRIRRRELPANFIIATQSAFFVILMSLIAYVSFFDVQRWVNDIRADRPAAATAAPSPVTPATAPGAPATTPAPAAPAGK